MFVLENNYFLQRPFKYLFSSGQDSSQVDYAARFFVVKIKKIRFLTKKINLCKLHNSLIFCIMSELELRFQTY